MWFAVWMVADDCRRPDIRIRTIFIADVKFRCGCLQMRLRMRMSVPSLACTHLSDLATGNTFEDLKFVSAIAPQTIGKIFIVTCHFQNTTKSAHIPDPLQRRIFLDLKPFSVLCYNWSCVHLSFFYIISCDIWVFLFKIFHQDSISCIFLRSTGIFIVFYLPQSW